MTIGKTEKGLRLIIKGRVLNAETKQPYSDILLYVYHTDQNGKYSKTGQEMGIQKWHGHLHGWCKIDALGNYEINTIHPAPYPDNTMPAHIHMYVRLNNRFVFYINDFVFEDDPLVNNDYLANLNNPHNPKRQDNGVISLSKNKNDYAGYRDILIRE